MQRGGFRERFARTEFRTTKGAFHILDGQTITTTIAEVEDKPVFGMVSLRENAY